MHHGWYLHAVHIFVSRYPEHLEGGGVSGDDWGINSSRKALAEAWLISDSFNANMIISTLLCVLSGSSIGHAASHSTRPVADLGYSRYQGVRLAAGVDQYLGMRYAAQPLGTLRFRASREPVHNSTLQDASEVNISCTPNKLQSSPSTVRPHLCWNGPEHHIDESGGLSLYQRVYAGRCHRTLEAARLGVYPGRCLCD